MTTKITQAAPATKGQLKQLTRIIQDALPDTKWIEELLTRLSLDKDSAQKLIESGNALHEVRKFLADKVRELSDSAMYADQVVESTYGYLSRPIDEQIAVLRQYDWGREIDWTINEVQQQLLAKPAPQGSEGYFAVVFDQTMVTDYEENPGVDQSGPVTLALNALSKQRDGRLVNYREGELGPQYYRRSKKSAEKMKQLWESQGCPTGIILIPSQFCIKHHGKSVLRARVVIRGTKFPLDAYETIQMVLTHENRLKHYDDLWLDLPGAEYSHGSAGFPVGFFSRNMVGLMFHGDEVWFGFCVSGLAVCYYGSVSGFLPQ